MRGGAQRVAQLLALADQLPLETDVSLAAASAPSPAAAVASPGPRTSGRREMVSWQPAGVIADISTWNYPVTLAINVSAAALLLGNTVLYKPSEHAALTGQAISRLLHEAGVPKEAHIVCT